MRPRKRSPKNTSGAKSVSASMLTGLIARLQYERGDVAGAEVGVLDALDLIETTAFHEGFRNAYFVLVRAAAHPRRSCQSREPAQSRRKAELGARMGRGGRHAAGRAHAPAPGRRQHRRSHRAAAGLRGAARQAPGGQLMLEHAHPHLEHGLQGTDRCRFGQSGGRRDLAERGIRRPSGDRRPVHRAAGRN